MPVYGARYGLTCYSVIDEWAEALQCDERAIALHCNRRVNEHSLATLYCNISQRRVSLIKMYFYLMLERNEVRH